MLPIAQASVLRWVLMGGISTNQTCLAWPSPVVSWCQYGNPVSLLGGVVLCGTRRGVVCVGLCLAHCWVLRQQDLFAAMQRASSGVSFVPASGTYHRVPVLRGGGGLVDGVVV